MESISQPSDLTEKINKTLRELGSTAKWKRSPDRLEGTETLENQIIVMVDDVAGVLESFAPHLIVATNGKSFFVKYDGQPLEDLVNQILQTSPSIILMDYNLSETFKGSEVFRFLKERGFAGYLVGFSSDKDTTRDFERSGASFSIEKEAGYPESSIKDLAKKVD